MSELVDDGLPTPEVGEWGEEKYRLIQLYAKLFATSMKGKWDCLVYIDLFAASGRSQVRGTNKIIPASPLQALEIPDRFNQYIFCEQDETLITALKKRVVRDYVEVDARFIHGDSNSSVDRIIKELPQHGKQKKVLSFCFADPSRLKDLRFSTIQQLSSHFMDFLILIPTGMDATCNVPHNYIRPEDKTVDEFVGTSEWRKAWQNPDSQRMGFDVFLTKFYAQRMEKLGYRAHADEQTQLIRATDKHLPIYRLAFFSRHELGERFWKEVRKYATPQLGLNFDPQGKP